MPPAMRLGRHLGTWMLQFAAMEPDETLAIACTAVLPFLGGLIGATETTIIIITVGYVAVAIACVKLKHYLRRRGR